MKFFPELTVSVQTMSKAVLMACVGFFAVCSFAIAQESGAEIATEVTAVAGETSQAGADLVVSWTVGESLVETFSDGSVILSQGFHQPKIKVAPLGIVYEYKDAVSVFPNPAVDFINISLKNSPSAIFLKVKVELRDLAGRLVYTGGFSGTEHQIDVQLMASGAYILRLTNEDNQLVGSYKIEKFK